MLMAKILIADDSAFMRKIVRNALEKLGHKDIIEAANGSEALDKYKSDKPDLVLLDIIMPDVGGIDVLRQIFEIDKDAKVIMCTAVGQDAMVEECNGLGAKGYIIKPFDEKKISEAIGNVLK